MDRIAVSNDMMENSVRTCHLCCRCIASFAVGSFKCLGKFGCVMTDFSDATEDAEDRLDLYSSWQKEIGGGETAQYFKCLYCFFSNSDCVAVSRYEPEYPIMAQTNTFSLLRSCVRRFWTLLPTLTSWRWVRSMFAAKPLLLPLLSLLPRTSRRGLQWPLSSSMICGPWMLGRFRCSKPTFRTPAVPWPCS